MLIVQAFLASPLHRQYKTARTETRWHLLLKTGQMPTQTSASRGYVLFIGDARNAQKSLNCLPACEHTRGVLKAWKDTDHRRCRMRCGLEMPGFSLRIPLARSIRNSKMIYYIKCPGIFRLCLRPAPSDLRYVGVCRIGWICLPASAASIVSGRSSIFAIMEFGLLLQLSCPNGTK